MVAAGFTGVDDVFSGERNFLQAYAVEPDPGRLAHGLGQEFEILGTNIKKWSAGSPAQSAIDGFLREAGARPWQRELTVPVLAEALTPPPESSSVSIVAANPE